MTPLPPDYLISVPQIDQQFSKPMAALSSNSRLRFDFPDGRSSISFFSLCDSRRFPQRSYADVTRCFTPKSAPIPNLSSSLKKNLFKRNHFKIQLCFRCGDLKHFAKDCRNSIRCFLCGGFGHRRDRCSAIFRGDSVLELMHFNCLMFWQKLSSLLDFFVRIFPKSENDGAYMLLLLGWHMEGVVDGLLWHKRSLDDSRSDIFPPLPRALERKEHAFHFCLNIWKLKRLFADSCSNLKRKALRLLEEILVHFEFINLAVTVDHGLTDFQVVPEYVDDNVLMEGGISKPPESQMMAEIVDVNDMVLDNVKERQFLEEELVELVGQNWDIKQFDYMILDPCVQSCLSHSDEKANGTVLFNKIGLLEELEGEMVSDLDGIGCGSVVDVADFAIAKSFNVEGLGAERHIVCDLRLYNSFDVLFDHDKEGECTAKMDLDGYSMVLPKNAGSGSNQLTVIHPVSKNDVLGLECGEICSSQGILGMSKGVFPFSKRLAADRMNKRRRTSAVMKFDLWLAMNKGICVNCDQFKSWLVDHSQIGDSDLVGMQEVNGERSHDSDSDLSISLSRRSKRRVYPRSGLVRRSARIRSYTRFR